MVELDNDPKRAESIVRHKMKSLYGIENQRNSILNTFSAQNLDNPLFTVIMRPRRSISESPVFSIILV